MEFCEIVMEKDIGSGPESHSIKRVWIPPRFFEYVDEAPGHKKMSNYRCLLGCVPKLDSEGKPKYCRISNSSRYNARRHIMQMHSSENNSLLEEFDKAVVNHSFHKKESTYLPKKRNIVTQEEFDNLILDLLVVDVEPISAVNKIGFRQIINKLAPHLTIKGRKFFTRMLRSKFVDAREHLKKVLENTVAVGTTVDCWMTHRKSYLGMTVHWFDDKLDRKSACLAIRRVNETHSYLALSKLMEDIHVQFRIAQKVICTTTDNGSNFVNAFGMRSLCQYAVEESEGETDDVSDAEENEEVDEEEVGFIPVGDILDEAQLEECKSFSPLQDVLTALPPHRRCASYLLHLVSKIDVEKIPDKKFQSLRQIVESKMQLLWEKQSSSSKHCDVIRKHLGKPFVSNKDTRWNCMYNAMFRVHRFLLKQHEAFEKVMKELQVSNFRPAEVEYLNEYLKIMNPIVDALEILQGEKRVGMGYLLPTITVLKRKLEAMTKDRRIKHCMPLVRGLLSSISNRFASMFREQDLKLSAICDPRFKTTWVEDPGEIRKAEKLLYDEYHRENERIGNDYSPLCSAVDSDGSETDYIPSKRRKEQFFASLTVKKSDTIVEVESYLKEPIGHLSQLNSYPVIMKIFKRYNAGLPSSAAIERLFSQAGSLYSLKRDELSDTNFEMLLFLKMNNAVISSWM